MKKTYITPAINVVLVKTNCILCGSLGGGDTPNGNISNPTETTSGSADSRFFDFDEE